MIPQWLLRVKGLVRRAKVEAEFDEELRFHLDREIERNIARGMSPDEAHRAARRVFGDPARIKEEARETWRWRWLDELTQDLRYAARGLRRNPAYTVVSVLSLGFGIGATTTLFGVVDALDFRPLPYPAPERLVWLTELLPQDSERCPGCPWITSPSTAAEWQAGAESYEGMGFWSRSSAYFGRGDVVESVNVGHASPGFFGVLEIVPALGREFVPRDTLGGSEPVALLSHAAWQRIFGGDPSVLGRRLDYFGDATLADSRHATVVGVLPEGFRFDGQHYPFWIPYPRGGGLPGSRFANVLARLRPGVARAAAQSELGAITRNLSEDPNGHHLVAVRPLRERLGAGAGEGRTVLLGVTGLVLLIAVMNVAGLSLARTLSRDGELSIRRTLGAPRPRLVRQFLVEGILLGIIGGGIGVLVMVSGLGAATTWFQLENAATALELDYRTFGFGVGLSVLVGVLCVLPPAIRIGRGHLKIMPGERVGSTSTSSRSALTSSLLAAQVAVALVLLTGAGLLGSEFLKVRYLDIGFNPEGLYETSLYGAEELTDAPEAWREVIDRARADVWTVRGVSSVTLRHSSALSPSVVRPEGFGDRETDGATPRVEAVDMTFFETLETPIVQGRGFTRRDQRGERAVAVLNQAAANYFWPDGGAVGRQVFVGDSEGAGEWLTVVGVAADIERGEMVERHWGTVYRPLAQAPIYHPVATLYVRLKNSSGAVLSTVQTVLRDALGHPTRALRPVEQELEQRFREQRYNAAALNLFAAFALLLAAMGIYGTVAYAVARRTRELGIRMALGAGKRKVLGLVTGRASIVTVVGVALGLLGSLVLARFLEAFVAATAAADPWLIAGSALVMMAIASVAAYLPARRATSVDPAIALRNE